MTQKRFRKLMMALGFTPRDIEHCIRCNKYNIRLAALVHDKETHHYDYQFEYGIFKEMKGE